jgi:formylmethanofuran dehydrogenase subunit E
MEQSGVHPRIRDYVNRCVRFHSYPAPGVIIAVHMVDYAMELLGKQPGDKIFAVCETRKCAPDPIQVILGSTAGNNRLRVLPVGRFALTLTLPTDDPSAEGVRVYVDPAKVGRFPTLAAWFTHSEGSKKKETEEALYTEIFQAGREILSYERVRVPVTQKKEWASARCSSCGELVPADLLEDGVCPGCGSLGYYEKIGA